MVTPMLQLDYSAAKLCMWSTTEQTCRALPSLAHPVIDNFEDTDCVLTMPEASHYMRHNFQALLALDCSC